MFDKSFKSLKQVGTFALLFVICSSNAFSQEADSSRLAYLEKATYQMVLESITDTIPFDEIGKFSDYRIRFKDSILLIQRNSSTFFIPLEDCFYGLNFSKRHKKGLHGFIVYRKNEEDAIIIERWRKGVLKTRRFFLLDSD